MTSTWDNNGACVECGYTPFQLTEFCSQCNPTKISKFNENEKIKNIEERLSQYGVQYLFMNDFRGIPIIYQHDYEELDKYLRAYKHFEYVICRFSGEKVCVPEEQLIIRVQDFIKCRTLHNSIKECDEVKEEEISFVVQINGKKRGIFKVKRDLGEKEVLKIIRINQDVEKFLTKQSIKKIIFVPNRLINIII